jgi:prepilin-type N-terminal cleavage/methylation domain-containing protein
VNTNERVGRQRRKRGFSLVETIVGMGLLGLVSLGIMTFLGTSIRLNGLAVQRSIATGLASDRVHKLTGRTYQGEDNWADYLQGEETGSGASPTFLLTADYGEIVGYPDYRRVVTLTYNAPVAGMLLVESSVFWQNVHQGEKSHTMLAYVHPDLERAQ